MKHNVCKLAALPAAALTICLLSTPGFAAEKTVGFCSLNHDHSIHSACTLVHDHASDSWCTADHDHSIHATCTLVHNHSEDGRILWQHSSRHSSGHHSRSHH